VLAVLWKAARPMSVGEVVEHLAGGLAYATVSTILTRLHAKELVVRTTVGRAYWYEPAVTQSEYVSEQVRRFLTRGDRSAVLQGFLGGLSRDDEQALRDMLQDDHEPQDDHDPQEGGAAP
jgi:predicted transcriptional regulator